MARQRSRWRWVAVALVAMLAATGRVVALPSPVRAAQPAHWQDFNNDGHADLAIGIPGEIVRQNDAAGAVQVLYGSATGLTTNGNQIWTQDRLVHALDGGSETNDRFGAALASGDFDGDGFGDLAIGVPGEDLEEDGSVSIPNSGFVQVLYGSTHGLVERATGGGVFGGTFEAALGSHLVALDIINAAAASDAGTGDGVADLAASGGPDFGAVLIFVGGTATFLTDPPHRRVLSIGPSDEVVLAAGQLDSDPGDELLVGLPGASGGEFPDVPDAGRFLLVNHVAPHDDDDLDQESFSQSDFSGAGPTEAGDRFGSAFAVGQFFGGATSPEEVLVGAPGETLTVNGSPVIGAGVVDLLLPLSTAVEISKDADGVPGVPQAGDQFGSAIAVGGFDSETKLDFAVGIPGARVGTATHAGSVIVFLGTGTKLLLDQDSAGVAGTAARGDRFGSSLTAAGFGFDASTDLAVGVPRDDEPNGIRDAGAVNVFYGATSGPSGTNDSLFTQATTGIPKDPTADDRFGDALR